MRLSNIVLVAALIIGIASSFEAPSSSSSSSFSSKNKNAVNVLDYGAVPNNASHDSTAAFQEAIDDAVKLSAFRVYAPPGMFYFDGSISVAVGVTLFGSYDSVPSHDLRNNVPLNDGTVLVPRGGRGSESGDPFITIPSNGVVKSLVIYYAEQEKVKTPVPYPWTFLLNGNNAALTDTEILGAWNAINATLAHRHYIARVQGHPINIGVNIDSTYDIGRLENVHWNPWFSSSHPFIEYQLIHGRGFVFGRSDWEYVFFNCLCVFFFFYLLLIYPFFADTYSTHFALATPSDIIL